MRSIPFLVVPLVLSAGVAPLAQHELEARDVATSWTARARAHYAEVERELTSCTPESLTAEQRAERERLVAELRSYRERGEFGAFAAELDERVPQFVDERGRRCAVAQLLHASGEDALVDCVRASDNEAWVLDLAGNPQFTGWLARSGLSLDEAARIQLPVVKGGRRPPTDGGSSPPPAPPSGSDSVPPPPIPAPPKPERGAATPLGSGPISIGPAGVLPPNAQGGPSTPPPTESDSDWSLWWEHNKLAYLQPNRLRLWDITHTGDELASYDERLARLRASMLPAVKGSLENADAQVRSAAAVTYARGGGAGAVEALRALFSDVNETVRQRAILALGATGTPEAATILLALAREQKQAGSRSSRAERPTPLARPLAIVALGLGRRAGFDASIDAEIAALLEDRRDGDRERVGIAAFIYHTLAPSELLEPIALEIALDRKEPIALRCRAVESLRSTKSAPVLSKLQDLLSGPSLELRRSVALALGKIENDLALPALLTAYEMEAEPLARGFLLVSIGQRGGPKARAFLLRVHEADDSGARPWCALALGILARQTGDPELREILRKGARSERNHDTLAARWIASGLARDEEAVPNLATALTKAASERERMYAASALALIGNEPARAALLAKLPLESSPLVRVAIAQALGQIGNIADAGALFGVLSGLREPELEGLCAVALGFHGSSEALRGVAELSAARTTSAVPRAAAIDALGILLGRSPAFALSEVSRQSNHAVFTDWVDELFQVTL